MHSVKIDRSQEVCVKPLALLEDRQDNSFVGNGSEGLGKSGQRRRQTVALWAFPHPSHLRTRQVTGETPADGGLESALPGLRESKQFTLFLESHFSHLCNRDHARDKLDNWF